MRSEDRLTVCGLSVYRHRASVHQEEDERFPQRQHRLRQIVLHLRQVNRRAIVRLQLQVLAAPTRKNNRGSISMSLWKGKPG